MASRITWRGQIAPDIEVKTTRGDTFQLSDNVGKKIIMLNFFATWCQSCREEMPELNRYFNDHKSESFVLVGIDAEENPNTVAGFLSELRVRKHPQGTILRIHRICEKLTTQRARVLAKKDFPGRHVFPNRQGFRADSLSSLAARLAAG